ncbi:alanine racemase [Helicosporidium sp. ATCC 50920]|nr:alanine racemase [Helicosporidium sp. ATCC 50920]|eukprot:KDD74108.1 alanine racemase [Helicosporidium sp. ATCC 50920]
MSDDKWASVPDNLHDVTKRAREASLRGKHAHPPRLVAVSKLQPVAALEAAYSAGHRCFGENYAHELAEKAAVLPKDVQWHFIGHLQSNKVKALVEGVSNLAVVETVDSIKLANKLDAAVAASDRCEPLRVFVQVNTSGEESKSGVDPAGVCDLAHHVFTHCANLRFGGLMTIGMPDYTSKPENFDCLNVCRIAVCQALGLPPEQVELSMGMSGDFEAAAEMGSTNIRVGSTIFGTRQPR